MTVPIFVPLSMLASLFAAGHGLWGFPGGTVEENPPASTGDVRVAGSIPESGRSCGVGNSNPLRYSSLKNHMDREAWWTTVLRVAKSWTQLSRQTDRQTDTHTHTRMRVSSNSIGKQ